jgi:hypothetical protein
MSSLRTALARVLFIGALGVPAAAVFVPSDASASVSIAIAYENLVKDADAVAVITPGEQKAIWEDGRIYTYTRVKVDQGVAGDIGTSTDGWVRTMGGVVGKIGQLVDGEPVFVAGKPSLLFLRKFKTGEVYEVSARAQGQYPINVDEKTKVRRLVKSANVGMLLPPKEKGPVVSTQTQTQSTSSGGSAVEMSPQLPRLAQEILHDKPLDDVTRDIATTWKRLHPTPAK